jgi:hypothetical protein
MNLLQGFENRISEADFALNSELTPFTGFGRIECVAGQSIGESSYRSTPVDLGLGALSFKLVENSGECRDLSLVEIELVGQEAQGPAHSELAAATAESTFVLSSRTVPGRTSGMT